jgi:hypothetical protein
MFSIMEFLKAAAADTIFTIVDNGIPYITSIRDLGDVYNDRTFSHWKIDCGRLILYLD